MPSSTTSSELAPRPLRVLLADDHEAVLARAASVLAPSCRIVGRLDNGLAALDAATRLRPDVIVLDISMPGMTGLEVAQRLREADSPTAIVFLTVHDDVEILHAAQAAGAFGYVIKPRLASDLLRAVLEAHAHRPFVSVLRAVPPRQPRPSAEG